MAAMNSKVRGFISFQFLDGMIATESIKVLMTLIQHRPHDHLNVIKLLLSLIFTIRDAKARETILSVVCRFGHLVEESVPDVLRVVSLSFVEEVASHPPLDVHEFLV